MTTLDLSADTGLLAVFLATANICLGLLIAVRYSPSRLWPHRRINIFAVHNWTAYSVMASVLAHPVILLFSKNIRWRLLDVAFPVWSPVQPIENTIGAISLYLIVVVLTHLIFSASARSSPVEAVSLPHLCGDYLFLHSRHSYGSPFEGQCNRSSGWRKNIC